MDQEFQARPMEGPLLHRGIHPIGLTAVNKLHLADWQAVQEIKHGYDDASYRPVRMADALLVPRKNYAELPGFHGQSAQTILQNLPEGASVLDVGCANGGFGREIVDKINHGIRAFGFDARVTEGQSTNLTGVSIGNVYDLNQQHFPQVNFNLVLSSALVYHLSDPLLGIMKMAKMVKDNGLLLVSTVPRVVNSANRNWEEKEDSFIPDSSVDYRYYGGRNIYDTQGRLIPSRKMTQLLGKKLGFDMEYGTASIPNSGAMTFGGQISGARSRSPNDTVRFFYCETDGDQLPNIWKNSLGYIVTETDEEAGNMQKLGYIEMPTP